MHDIDVNCLHHHFHYQSIREKKYNTPSVARREDMFWEDPDDRNDFSILGFLAAVGGRLPRSPAFLGLFCFSRALTCASACRPHHFCIVTVERQALMDLCLLYTLELRSPHKREPSRSLTEGRPGWMGIGKRFLYLAHYMGLE